MRGRVLVVAGSDSGGGAGIQADVKTITALGGYAATAITALTAQNTLGVQGVLPVPPEFIRQQVVSVLSDLGADAVKTGMLGNAAAVELVAAVLAEHARGIPLVLDPVMVAKGGARLLDEDAVEALRRRVFPLAALVTLGIAAVGWLIGVVVGIGFALIMQRWRLAEWGLLPWIVLSQTVPLIALAPLVRRWGAQLEVGAFRWEDWMSVAVIASYLELKHVPAAGTLAIFCAALMGAGLGSVNNACINRK